MSYSFSVQAATKAEAIEKVAAELAAVVKSQPSHEAEADVVRAAAESFIDLLRDDESQNIALTVSGSIWQGEQGLNSVSANISASVLSR
jgi:hypothetical protein